MNLTRPILDKRRYAECPDKLFDVTNIGMRFRNCTVEEIPKDAKYKAIIEDWQKNIKEYVDKGKWLLLWGGFGTGKTAAASIILKEVLLRNGSAFMLNQDELVDYKLNSSDVSFGSFSLESVVKDSNILLLDDVGASRDKEIVRELIEWVCRSRYDSERSLIATTNLNPSNELKKYFSGKVMSMFLEIGTVVEMNDTKWRQELRDK